MRSLDRQPALLSLFRSFGRLIYRLTLPLFFLFLWPVVMARDYNRDRRKSYVSAIAAGLVMAITDLFLFLSLDCRRHLASVVSLLLLLARPLSYQRDLKRIVQTCCC